MVIGYSPGWPTTSYRYNVRRFDNLDDKNVAMFKKNPLFTGKIFSGSRYIKLVPYIIELCI